METRKKTARPALSVVSPCFNEEESLPELYRRVSAACREQVGDDYEIVLVDDGSSDASRTIIRDLAETDPHVVGVFLSRNYGHQIALTSGLHICRGDRTLIIDADLQDPPELLGDMIRLMDTGADVVYGKRTARQGESRFKRFSAGAFYRLLNRVIDIDIPTDTGDFRLMSRRSLDELNRMPEQHRFIRGMVSWLGFRQVPLEYVREKRFAGETKYPLRKMIHFAIDAIAGFSIVPLRLSVFLGLFCALIGAVFLVYTIHGYLVGNTIQGWTTTMTAVLVLGGGQLLMLGVIGEYLGRLYMQSKNRPLYIIQDIVRSDPDDPAPAEKDSGRKSARARGKSVRKSAMLSGSH